MHTCQCSHSSAHTRQCSHTNAHTLQCSHTPVLTHSNAHMPVPHTQATHPMLTHPVPRVHASACRAIGTYREHTETHTSMEGHRHVLLRGCVAADSTSAHSAHTGLWRGESSTPRRQALPRAPKACAPPPCGAALSGSRPPSPTWDPGGRTRLLPPQPQPRPLAWAVLPGGRPPLTRSPRALCRTQQQQVRGPLVLQMGMLTELSN